MAKISFEMDTESKVFTVSIDGKEVGDVESIMACRRMYDTEYNRVDDDDDDRLCHVEIVRREEEQDGVCRTERICASEKGVETKVEQSKPSTVAEDIAKFMSSRRPKSRRGR